MGDEFIILGNVNWGKDTSTHHLINGVFLELYKTPYPRQNAYTLSEIEEIERLIEFHDTHLREPKLIALEPWRITKEVSYDDRNTLENRKYAKLFTAMATVIPKNGYILYADGNPDTPSNDHAHAYYDFYKIDLGKPTSSMTKIDSGIAYKEFEQGVIIYNRTNQPVRVKFEKGEIDVEALEGVICRELRLGWDCT
jgi:hypothetical protein